VQYQDVGLNIEFTAEGRADGLSLRSKVEQSSLAEQKSGVGLQDPVLSQSVLEGSTALTLGKPLILGSLDIPGSTRKQEIAVVAELVSNRKRRIHLPPQGDGSASHFLPPCGISPRTVTFSTVARPAPGENECVRPAPSAARPGEYR